MKLFEKIKEKRGEVTRELGWILSHTRVYWKPVLLFSLLGLLGTAMSLYSAQYSKWLIDAVANRAPHIWLYAGGTVLLALGNVGTNALTGWLSVKISVRVQNEMQSEVFDRVMHSEWESLGEYRSGDLLSRLNSDVSSVSSSMINWIPNLLTAFAMFAAALVMMVYYDPIMALLSLAALPVTLLFSRLLLRRMHRQSREMKEVGGELMAFQQETLSLLQPIKAFDMVDMFGERLRAHQTKYAGVQFAYSRLSILASSLLSALGILASYLCLGWAVYRLWSGDITFGTLLLFVQLATKLSGSFRSLVQLVPSTISVCTSAGRVMAVIGLPKENTARTPEIDALTASAKEEGLTLTLRDVQVAFSDGDTILRQVKMQAKPGEIVALVGPSGEGKTTLLRLMLGLLTPAGGTADISDAHGHTAPVSAATRVLFTYVPQGKVLFDGTIADNVRLMRPDAGDEEVAEVLRLACADGFVNELPQGINTPLSKHGQGLSEGQAQRLSLARALIKDDAPFVLLDEVTSALDAETEQRVLQNLLSWNTRKTYIITTHRPSVLTMCHRVYRVHDNRLEEISPEEAMQKGSLLT